MLSIKGIGLYGTGRYMYQRYFLKKCACLMLISGIGAWAHFQGNAGLINTELFNFQVHSLVSFSSFVHTLYEIVRERDFEPITEDIQVLERNLV